MTNTKLRIYAAWALLAISVVGWPVSMVTLAKDEPPFVLSLSWLAIILTSLDLISSQDIRDKQ